LPPTVVPSHFSWTVVKHSVAAIAARRHDRREVGEIEIDDRLEGVVGRGVAQTVGQRLMLGDELGLEREQFGDGVAPAPRATAAVC